MSMASRILTLLCVIFFIILSIYCYLTLNIGTPPRTQIVSISSLNGKFDAISSASSKLFAM